MKTYELTEKEFQELVDASKPVPYIIVGGRAPMSPYERAMLVWDKVAKRVNCERDTIEAYDKNNLRMFKAMPLD
jgi:hypothetical protein